MKRLYSLDALRGIAALAVVAWHWQHFFSVGAGPHGAWLRSSQPFYWLLEPLYYEGWAAVDLFFALSGFVFFWLYADAIREQKIGAAKFALLRFSRLYPLHFATLLAVAALQMAIHGKSGAFFIYNTNDRQHFLSGLLMAQQWLPPSEIQSFNGPAWSVSVEVLLYIIFFAFVRTGMKRIGPMLLLSASGLLLYPFDEMIARGIMGFFLGGAVFHATTAIKARTDAKSITIWVGAFALLGWILGLAEFYAGTVGHMLQGILSDAPDSVIRFCGPNGRNLFLLAFIFVVSPLTIATLVLYEQVFKVTSKRLSFLGDISYSVYMLHFPMQLCIAFAALTWGFSGAIFQTGTAMVLFYATLIGISTLSFRYFERPLQIALRNWFGGEHARDSV